MDMEETDGEIGLTTTPPSKMHPTIVVPVLVAFGRGTPLACKAALRVWLEKSNPGIFTDELLELLELWGCIVLYRSAMIDADALKSRFQRQQ